MKNILFCLCFLCFNFNYTIAQDFFDGIMPAAYTQNAIAEDAKPYGWVQRVHNHMVRKTTVQGAQYLSDVIDHYPESWIDAYVSTKVTLEDGKNVFEAKGKANKLTKEQASILKKAALNHTIRVEVVYKQANVVTAEVATRTMNYAFRVKPDEEAAFEKGDLRDLLLEQATTKMEASNAEKFQRGVLHFYIGPSGKAENIRVIESSGALTTDQLLMDVLREMPKWKPAQNANGKRVKQEFEFSIGFGSGGC